MGSWAISLRWNEVQGNLELMGIPLEEYNPRGDLPWEMPSQHNTNRRGGSGKPENNPKFLGTLAQLG